tara:strand:- start:103 stop:456 length:354 start_codon:yes stop_codon:yes gene_type:complete
MGKKDNWIGLSKQERLKREWEEMSEEEKKVAQRKQLKGFLEMFQGSAPVMFIDGKAQEHSPMSEEEANLHLAIFDGDVEPTLEVQLELAQLEASRWPNNKKLQAKMWKLMAEIEESK